MLLHADAAGRLAYRILVCLLLSVRNASATTTPPSIIVDTDIFSDVDDVGALAIANVPHNRGAANLLAVMVNTPSSYGALAVSAINTYFGNGEVPVAAMRPLSNETFVDNWAHLAGEFAARVSWNWPRTLTSASTTREPVELYRKILAASKDGSITVVSLGFLNNLWALLDSPGDIASPLDGMQLVSRKAAKLVVMGGRYPSGREFNFASNPKASREVINRWPRNVPVTYSGLELGATVFSGGQLVEHAPKDSPVLAAYQWYVGRCETARESWDPITTQYAIEGLSIDEKPLFSYGNDHGYNEVAEDGTNHWVDDASVTNQHWLRLADGVLNTTVAWVIGQYLAQGPGSSFGHHTEL